MKRFILTAFCLIIGGSIAMNAQNTKAEKELKNQERVQKVLAKKQKTDLYKAEVEAAMHGFRMGGEYSFRTIGTVGVKSAQKHGIHYFAGYRFTKRWYVGGIVGVDVTTPFTIERSGWLEESYNYSITRQDKVYVPVMADVRFYCNVNRVSTYLYTNLGAEFSHTTAGIFLFGLGFDIHTIKSQCVNLSFGIGMGSWETAEGNGLGGLALDEDPGYGQYDGFAFNLKLGYAF